MLQVEEMLQAAQQQQQTALKNARASQDMGDNNQQLGLQVSAFILF